MANGFSGEGLWRCRTVEASATDTTASRGAVVWLTCVDVLANCSFADSVAVVTICLRWSPPGPTPVILADSTEGALKMGAVHGY